MVVFGLEIKENDSLDRTVLKKKFVRKFTNQNDKNIQYTFHGPFSMYQQPKYSLTILMALPWPSLAFPSLP